MGDENLETTDPTLESDFLSESMSSAGKAPKETESKETSDKESEASDNESEDKPFKSFQSEDEWKLAVGREARSLAQSEADKRTQKYSDQTKQLRNQMLDMQKQLNSKDIDNIFTVDAAEDEDKAKQRKSALERFNAQYLEYKEKATNLQNQLEESDRRYQSLNLVEKRQKARDLAIQHLLPDGERTISKYNDFIDDLMESETLKEMELKAKSRGSELKGKAKPTAKPMIAKGSGGSGKGHKPTIEELKASNPFETEKKVKSGEWVL